MIAPLAPRAVLDTSVLVPAGLRRDLHEAARRQAFIAIWSPWIIGELYRVLTWRWLARTPDFSLANEAACSRSAKTMMALLIATFEIVAPVPPYPAAWPSLTDGDDHPIWAAALLSRAQYVVSENIRHFPPIGQNGRHSYQGVEYLTARTFFSRLAQGSS
jgi:predicted nucleic acid-binding protein